MIALNETDPTAAEVAFYLPLAADPFTGPGLVGHDFTNNAVSGEVRMRLPGGAWFSVTGVQIIEKGKGRYVVQLTALQTAVAGVILIRVVVTGAQPYGGIDQIGVTGGDFQVGDTAALVPFYLPQSADPVFGTPITGHSFVTGEVKVATPGAAYANANVANVVEEDNGHYWLLLTPAQVAARGKVFVYVEVAGAQRFEGFATILTPSAGSPLVAAPPAPVPVVNPALTVDTVSHAAKAISRLAQEFRT